MSCAWCKLFEEKQYWVVGMQEDKQSLSVTSQPQDQSLTQLHGYRRRECLAEEGVIKSSSYQARSIFSVGSEQELLILVMRMEECMAVMHSGAEQESWVWNHCRHMETSSQKGKRSSGCYLDTVASAQKTGTIPVNFQVLCCLFWFSFLFIHLFIWGFTRVLRILGKDSITKL